MILFVKSFLLLILLYLITCFTLLDTPNLNATRGGGGVSFTDTGLFIHIKVDNLILN